MFAKKASAKDSMNLLTAGNRSQDLQECFVTARIQLIRRLIKWKRDYQHEQSYHAILRVMCHGH